MTKRLLLLLFILVLPLPGQARLFFIGSNPSLSKIAFPQDICLIPGSSLSYTFGYQPVPFWGDIDDPVNKPKPSYTAVTEQAAIVLVDPALSVSEFNRDGHLRIFSHGITYHHSWSDRLKTMFMLKGKHGNMESTASGMLRATDDEDNPEPVLFTYELSRKLWMIYFESILAYRAGTVPLGMKIGFGYEETRKPRSSMEAFAHGRYIKSERILWGWSTSGCKHIFGYRHINGDAWFKDSYSNGNTWQIDLQLGATFKKVKFGARYRLRLGHYDKHSWYALITAGDDPTPEEAYTANFAGFYFKQPWADSSVEHIGRVYANIIFKKNKFAEVKTLLFFGVDHYEKKEVYTLNDDLAKNSRETFINYIGEVNPNFTIRPGRGVTIDAGLLVEFSWTGYKNLYNKWNSSVGGAKETYRNSSVYIGEEQSWEKFSHAEEYFFDLGWEVNASFPLFRNKNHLLALTLMLIQNSKFTFITKHYGQNAEAWHMMEFYTIHKRRIEKQEVWLNSSFTLFYKYKNVFFILTYIEPLVYSLTMKTRITGPLHSLWYRSKKKLQTSVMDGGAASLNPNFFGSEIVRFTVGYRF